MAFRARILGFDLTLNCSSCGKECYLTCDPSFDDRSPDFNLLILIHDTHIKHLTRGCLANPKPPEEELAAIKAALRPLKEAMSAEVVDDSEEFLMEMYDILEGIDLT